MKNNSFKKIIYILLLGITFSYGQIYTNIQYVEITGQGTYPGCQTLDFGTSNSKHLAFFYKLTKSGNIEDGYLKIKKKLGDNIFPTDVTSIFITSNMWNGNELTGVISATIFSSSFNESGSSLYLEFTQVSQPFIPYNSCQCPLVRTPPPSFSFSPTSLSIPCGDTSSRTFKVTPANIPSDATVTYQWSVGAGWSGTYDTSMSSIILTPSANSPLGNISVVPKINGVSQATKSCTVTRSAFTDNTINITGTSTFCNTGQYSFSIINPNNYNVTWSIPQSNIANIVSATNNQVVVNILQSNGNFTLNATVNNPCNQSIVKLLECYVGAPSVNIVYDYFEHQPAKSTLCIESANPEISLEQQGITNVVFKRLPANTIVKKYTPFCIRTSNPWCVEATVTNSCGSTSVAYDCFLLRVSNKKNKIETTYTVFPNPSNDIVNIELRDEKNQPERDAKISGELFDMLGLSKTKVEIIDNKAILSVRGLNKGIYVLKIYINDQVETHQIAVE